MMLQAKTKFTKPNPKRKIKYHPLSLFQSGQDLPIFTASPDCVPSPFLKTDHANIAKPELEQMSLFEAVQ